MLRIKKHLSFEEVTARYKICPNPREKSYWHLVWLMAHPNNPRSVLEAAKIVGFCKNWARTLAHRYNEEGPENFIDKRKRNKGKEPILDKKQQASLRKTLTKKRPPDGGLWTGPKVAKWIEEKTKKPISSVGGWKWIRRSGFTLQIPRPKNNKSATPKETEDFKKNWMPSMSV